jgi:hypothetical protein
MGQHIHVYDVKVGDRTFHVSCSVKSKMMTNLSNFQIPYISVRKYRKAIDREGSSLFLNNTLERAITVPELARILQGKRV